MRVALYRASQSVVDLGWVDFDLIIPSFDQADQPHLPNSHQPGQSVADRGKLKIQSAQPRSMTNWDTLYNYETQALEKQSER